jgi:hypothetical protein
MTDTEHQRRRTGGLSKSDRKAASVQDQDGSHHWAAVREARRAANATLIGACINVAVVITALLVPYLQQHLQSQTEEKTNDRSELIAILDSGSLLDWARSHLFASSNISLKKCSVRKSLSEFERMAYTRQVDRSSEDLKPRIDSLSDVYLAMRIRGTTNNLAEDYRALLNVMNDSSIPAASRSGICKIIFFHIADDYALVQKVLLDAYQGRLHRGAQEFSINSMDKAQKWLELPFPSSALSQQN